jgi:hypothetical protein
MSQSRRKFLGAGLTMAAASALGAASLPAQNQGPTSPSSSPFPRDPIGGPMPTIRRDPAARMRANQEQIQKHTARLVELVAEVQKDLDENDTRNVLSLNVIKKTEEIEKLARQLRDLIRG